MTRPAPLPAWLDLGGATAVVTGGGTHLGLAMAETLGELGATVYLVGRRAEVLHQAATTLRASGLDATAWPGDATDEAGMQQLADAVVERHGRLDVMVCNAGDRVGDVNVPDLPLTDLQSTLRLHVGSTLVSAQAAARVMIPKRGGAIITVGSIQGGLGSDRRRYGSDFRRSPASYHAAKGGVINLTRALACELGEHGITVNCVSPGHIPKTTMDDVTRERHRDAVPLGRLGIPGDLKSAVAAFATPGGRWITGQNLVVDGGWSAW